MSERGWSTLERVLAAACWGMKRLARYTMYVPGTTIYVPDAGAVACVKQRELHVRLQALVLELQSYQCIFADG